MTERTEPQQLQRARARLSRRIFQLLLLVDLALLVELAGGGALSAARRLLTCGWSPSETPKSAPARRSPSGAVAELPPELAATMETLQSALAAAGRSAAREPVVILRRWPATSATPAPPGAAPVAARRWAWCARSSSAASATSAWLRRHRRSAVRRLRQSRARPRPPAPPPAAVATDPEQERSASARRHRC